MTLQGLICKMTSQSQSQQENQRGTNWHGREVLALINIWGDEEYRHANDDPFSRKTKVMDRIASRLAELEYIRSVTQISNKIKQLKTKYKQVLDNNRRSGRARMEWEYFGEIDTILGARPAINPLAGHVLDIGLLIDLVIMVRLSIKYVYFSES